MTNTASRREARAAATLADPRWAEVLARDTGADGRFVYSVRSTGVYCRPSCGARTPRPENVDFHASRTEAEAAGFRPCKRCRPDLPPLAERQAATVAALCRQIDAADTLPSLDVLAASAGLSRFHLLRVFKAHTGLTPHAWATARRAARLRERLADGASVTEAIVDAGYGSTSRVYEKSARPLGMTPRRYRAGGADTDIRFAIAQCALGALLVAASTQGVCAIALGDDADALARDLQDRFPHARLTGDDAVFARLVAQVVGLVEAPRIGLALPLDIRGTAFQQRVWTALRAIPPGQTLSYTELAQRVGAPAAVRAVASACAANTLAVAVPCHRVVRTDGSLSGYRWGVARKRALLERERSD
ncbi:bifunctional DNA-binding transcriptional regulator/O6-methylguanine-DNA methyltransferase Ada [Methyloversatilis discipulorum]|uniref:bifunctional DNA-binding transcriptional regulator/O6-methylguanine-DNA methyltransferase Ada n=1 Tax=Methyloversatilis discipulorum TaxID=1119528 RepID=UPI001A3BD978|nr:bifunctional DNA-binding transcriptional regulator/O6-methylguanine-DNA methyltransferase Ada [Methyloversatilis discipulorum]MBL8469805.1 bifunctional DNA-binding transcriptional regulator/O6-methylguanine-DNA methyltransferase Ada [Methyloversatilis discipulorum]